MVCGAMFVAIDADTVDAIKSVVMHFLSGLRAVDAVGSVGFLLTSKVATD